MKYIIGIVIVFDVIYQLFGASSDVRWWMYYDFIHYCALFLMGLYYALERKSWLIGFLSAYFGFVLGNIVFSFGLSKKEYIDSIQLDAPLFCTFVIIILVGFIILKSWQNSKKTG